MNFGVPVREHTKPYPGISPSRPELSQEGRTVLVTGGSGGIGHAIARNFCAAGASKVIITGRRSNLLEEAVSKLKEQFPETRIEGKNSDAFSLEGIDALWNELAQAGTGVDVLVLNAWAPWVFSPILDRGITDFWEEFEMNIRAPVYHVDKFYKQPTPQDGKVCLFVSSQDIHNWASLPVIATYQLTKNSATCAMQQIAKDVPAEKMRIVSFHPSVVFTEAVRTAGGTEDTLPWSDENLPGQFAVWAASPEADFLHGRFVWCTWDVDDLKSGEVRSKIDADYYYLKVGVKGLS